MRPNFVMIQDGKNQDGTVRTKTGKSLGLELGKLYLATQSDEISGLAYLCNTTDCGFFVAMQSFKGPAGAPKDNGQGQVKESICDLCIDCFFNFSQQFTHRIE